MRRQLPRPHEVFLDHVGLFTADMGRAARALERLGFALTPFTEQVNAGAGGGVTAAGTANRCAMLDAGYLEALTPVADTPLADEMRRAIGRYEGLHLIALSVADAGAHHAHLERQGFAPKPPVRLSRPVAGPGGPAQARFTVVRVAPATMPEGRIQCVTHHTPGLVWPAHALKHANGAVALTSCLVAVADPEEAAARFARFAGRAATMGEDGAALMLDRGRIDFAGPKDAARRLGVAIPTVPFIAAAGFACRDMAATRAYLAGRGVAFVASAPDRLVVAPHEACGAALVFRQEGRAPRTAP